MVRQEERESARKTLKVGEAIPQDKKYCPDCKELRAITLFTSRTGKIYGYCQMHRNQRSRERYHDPIHGEQRKAANSANARQRNYGLSDETYQQMVLAQHGLCASCQKRPSKGRVLEVDHCHQTERVRDLLCNPCNVIIGQAQDRIEILELAIAYLQRHGHHSFHSAGRSSRETFLNSP